MAKRTANAVWEGTLREGKGRVKLGSGAFEGQYSFASRFEEGAGTNPEELIGAAHAGCFSMALAAGLTKAGHNPTRISTQASVSLEKVGEGFKITTIELNTEGEVPGIDETTFLEQAETAKKNCPVSQALAGTDIKLNATLVKSAGAWTSEAKYHLRKKRVNRRGHRGFSRGTQRRTKLGVPLGVVLITSVSLINIWPFCAGTKAPAAQPNH